MLIFKRISDLKSFLNNLGSNQTVGFVPTMGALHQGHLSLIAQAKEQNSVVVCSIFVNPTQFNNSTDFKTYPITIAKDIDALTQAGCNVLFLPEVEEIYPDGLATINVDAFDHITSILEGAHRPGHFNGVITVVKRLFEIVNPKNVYFGQKDYQQCLVVKELINYFNFNITFIMCESVREKDGLAMSSRNVRLTEPQRKAALLLSKALFLIKEKWFLNEVNLLEQAGQLLNDPLIQTEYLVAVNPNNLQTTEIGSEKAVILVAAQVGSTRLIDNILIGF